MLNHAMIFANFYAQMLTQSHIITPNGQKN